MLHLQVAAIITFLALAVTLSSPTPTPIKAKFNHRPEYYETVFSDYGWIWKDLSNDTRMGTRIHDMHTMIFLSHGSYQIAVGGTWDMDSGDFEFVDGFFPIALRDFVPFTTSVDIIRFKDANINNEPGAYETMIDGFKVELTIKDDLEENTRTIVLIIDEYR